MTRKYSGQLFWRRVHHEEPDRRDESGDHERPYHAAKHVPADDLVRRHRRDEHFLDRVHEAALKNGAGTLAVRRIDDLQHNESGNQELRVPDALHALDAAADCESKHEDVQQRRDDGRPDHLVDDLPRTNQLALDQRPRADVVSGCDQSATTSRVSSRNTSCSEEPSARSSAVGFAATMRPPRMIASSLQSASASSR